MTSKRNEKMAQIRLFSLNVFVFSEIKRCEEMERKLRYIETEIRREVIDIDQVYKNPSFWFPTVALAISFSLEKVNEQYINYVCAEH